MKGVRVPPAEDMSDQILIKHLELRHGDDLKQKFTTEPGQTEPRLNAPREWRTYHNAMHRLYPRKYDHYHEEACDD